MPEEIHASLKTWFKFVTGLRSDGLHRLYIKQAFASHGYLNRLQLSSKGIVVSPPRGGTACGALMLILEHPQDFKQRKT